MWRSNDWSPWQVVSALKPEQQRVMRFSRGLLLAIKRIVGAHLTELPLPILSADVLGPTRTSLSRWIDLARALAALPYTNATLRLFLRRTWPLYQAGHGGFARTKTAVMWLDDDGKVLVSVGRTRARRLAATPRTDEAE